MFCFCHISFASRLCREGNKDDLIQCSVHVGLTNIFPDFPVFTLPFNLAGFLWLPISIQLTWIHSTLQPHLAQDMADPQSLERVHNLYMYSSDFQELDVKALLFHGIFRSPAQIYLCSDEYVGILFLAAIAICNWRASLLCLGGSTVGTLFAALIGVDLERIAFGLHGYNAALTMMGVSCIFARCNVKNLAMAFEHSCLCVLLRQASRI